MERADGIDRHVRNDVFSDRAEGHREPDYGCPANEVGCGRFGLAGFPTLKGPVGNAQPHGNDSLRQALSATRGEQLGVNAQAGGAGRVSGAGHAATPAHAASEASSAALSILMFGKKSAGAAFIRAAFA